MPKKTGLPQKKCALCFIQKPLTQFMSIQRNRDGQKLYGTICCSCLGVDSSKFHLHSFQKKLKKLFQKLNNKSSIFNSNDHNDNEDEGGSGGKQLQKTKNVETLANEIERANDKTKLAEENLSDQKQKKLFAKHKIELNLPRPENSSNQQESNAATSDSDSDNEKKKEERGKELESAQRDETDAIAGKTQRDIYSLRKASRSAQFGSLGLGFGFTQHSLPNSNTNNQNIPAVNKKTQQHPKAIDSNPPSDTSKNQSTDLNKQGNTKAHQTTKTELQKAASLLIHTQQIIPNQNAPATASISNTKGASPSANLANLFTNKVSGQQQATQQQHSRETQSAEAVKRVEETLAAARAATRARWGK